MRLHVVDPDRPPLRLALVGFGHVGRAFARLLLEKEQALRERYSLDWRVTAILTGRHGWIADDTGVDLTTSLQQDRLPERGPAPPIDALPADVLVEVSTLSARDGQPALDSIRDALRSRMHVITANKGPIAYGYHELVSLARQHDRLLRFESTVADCLPVFNLARACLPTAEIRRARGVLNSTTNYLVSQAARGVSFEDALAEAQRLGIAERDPANDLEGWDAALKATIIANVLMAQSLRPGDVVRRPLTSGAVEQLQAGDGGRVRMVATMYPGGARWEPAALSPADPLYAVDGFSLALEVDTDVAGRLVVALHDPGVHQAAFGLLADLVSLRA